MDHSCMRLRHKGEVSINRDQMKQQKIGAAKYTWASLSLSLCCHHRHLNSVVSSAKSIYLVHQRIEFLLLIMAVRSQNGSANGDHETSSYIGTSSAASPRYRFGRSPASSTSGSWNSRRGLFAIEHTFANWRRPRLVLKKKRIRTSSDMPSMLPYILFAIAGLAGILLPFAELLSQGIPKLAKVHCIIWMNSLM